MQRGVWSHKRTNRLKVPDNMRILKLPDLPAFRKFDTIGPSGTHRSNINGRAAAIECYLDVGPKAVVRWKNYYHRDLAAYHGELDKKGDVAKTFLSLSDVNNEWGYARPDFSRIAEVVHMIVSECAALRETVRLVARIAAGATLDSHSSRSSGLSSRPSHWRR